jgi:hypothetical protein
MTNLRPICVDTLPAARQDGGRSTLPEDSKDDSFLVP